MYCMLSHKFIFKIDSDSGLEIEKNYSLRFFYFLAGQTNFGLPVMFFDLPQGHVEMFNY